MTTETQLAENDPIMVAWNKYQETEDYANTFKGSGFEEHRQGSLWAAFLQGWAAAKGGSAGLED